MMVGVVVVVIVLFCLVLSCFGEISRGWGIAGILGDVGPSLFPPHPLVALIYDRGRCARERLVLLDGGGKEGVASVRPCFSWLG